MISRGRIICFGELLLRLNAPGRELLLQSDRLDVIVGGAEANVAAALAQLGHDVSMVSRLPAGPLAEGVSRKLRQYGIDLSLVQEGKGRLGLYFMSTGAVLRPSEILYDRADSAFSLLSPEDFAWDDCLAGADWLHVSGITPATGPGPARAAVDAVQSASAHGTKVSFDGNYRQGLWQAWGGDAPKVLREILTHASLAFINERDLGLILDRDFSSRDDAVAVAFDTFPKLERIACTTREQTSVDCMSLCGNLFTRGGMHSTEPQLLQNVVDRIGTGDAFAGGVIHALLDGSDDETALRTGVALAVLKHSVPGDAVLVSPRMLEQALAEDGLDVRR